MPHLLVGEVLAVGRVARRAHCKQLALQLGDILLLEEEREFDGAFGACALHPRVGATWRGVHCFAVGREGR